MFGNIEKQFQNRIEDGESNGFGQLDLVSDVDGCFQFESVKTVNMPFNPVKRLLQAALVEN